MDLLDSGHMFGMELVDVEVRLILGLIHKFSDSSGGEDGAILYLKITSTP